MHESNLTGESPYGRCTSVAMQMLMGYHNYYSDRRLIPNEINGISTGYLSSDYGNIEEHPNFATQPEPGPGTQPDGLGLSSTGTMDAFFSVLHNEAAQSRLLLEQSVGALADSANDFVNKYSTTNNVYINEGFFSENFAKTEIDNGNPIILGMAQIDGMTIPDDFNFHVVVAYGYAVHNGEFGFIYHNGYGNNAVHMWAPSEMFKFQISMSVNSEQTFVDTGNNITPYGQNYETHRELYCSNTGVSTVEPLYTTNGAGNEILSVNYPLTGAIEIPEVLYGNTITSIGNGAFENQNITEIILPDTITSIGDSAFENCSLMTTIITNGHNYLDENISYIGEKAFANCFNLNINISNSNQTYSTENNILYNKLKTELIFAGNVGVALTIPSSVIQIEPFAFEENPNIYEITFNSDVLIGEKAFANCSNLHTILFFSYSAPIVGANSLLNNSATLYVPYDSQDIYETAFANYTNNIDSIDIQIQYFVDGTLKNTQNVHYGQTINNLYTTTKTGYDFAGWHDNVNLSGKPYENGDRWEFVNNIILYPDWEEKSYSITLNSNGGNYSSINSFNVKFNKVFSIPNTPLSYIQPTKTGNTFEGWYDSNGTKYITEAGQGTRLWDKATNTTLYARWAVKSYEIQINDNGSITWLGATGLSDVKTSINYGTVITSLNLVPTFKASADGYKEGKIFDRFELDGSEINWTSIPDLGNDGNVITIIPKWELETHTIYFDPIIEQSQVIIPKIQNYGTLLTLPTASAVGRTFKGWYTGPTAGQKITWTTMPDLTPLSENNYNNAQNNGSVQLYAQYDYINYIITFSKNGGSGGSNSVANANYGKAMPSASAPTRIGQTFAGYYYGDTKYYNADMTSARNWDRTSNATLTAKWTPIDYKITFNKNGGSGGINSVANANYGKAMPSASAPSRTEYDFLGYYYGDVKYYNSNMTSAKNYDLTSDITLTAKWDAHTFSVSITSIYTQNGVYEREDGLSIKTAENYTYTASSGKSFTYTDTSTFPPQQKSVYGNFTRINIWYSNSDQIPTSYYSRSGESITFYANKFAKNDSLRMEIYYNAPCVAEGTLITLADGRQVAVEDLTGNEQLLVWNLKTGTFDTAPILFIDSDSMTTYEVINLTFSDGTTVKVISEHAFWDINLNRYLFLRNDAAQYIGHWFNKQSTDANGNMTWTAVQLTNVVVANEVTTAWSPVTAEHLCYYVNEMLSMPGGTTGLINIFDVNPETMQYDQEAMQADIEEFGLFTYEEFAEILPVPQEIFNAFDAQYFKVAIGKGLITMEDITELVERYSEFFTE